MKLNRVFGVWVLAVCLACGGIQVWAQEEAPAASDMEQMMAEWQKYATPAEHHKFLEQMVGTWDAVAKVTMGPGAEPMESKSVSKLSMIFGGRWLLQEHTGDLFGQPLEGMAITGYDIYKEKYVSMWVDNSGTAMATSMGTCDAEGKTFTLKGLMDEPLTGERDKEMTYVTNIIDKDTFTFEIQETLPDGTSFVPVQITYTRQAE